MGKWDSRDSREILGVRVDFGLGVSGVMDVVESRFLKDGGVHYICTTNPEFIIEAGEDPKFKKIINGADLSVPDGIGVILAKRYLDKGKTLGSHPRVRPFLLGLWVGLEGVFGSKSLDKRVTGVDLTYKVCELSAKKGYSVFFLGGRPVDSKGRSVEGGSDIATLSADWFRRKLPGVNIVGSSSQFSYKESDDVSTIDYIHSCMENAGVKELDFLFVAYGQNKQESWISRNAHKIPAKVSIGVGRTFNYYSNFLSMVPKYIAGTNLGWLYGLLKEPWRIKRIWRAFPKFPLEVFKASLKSKS